MYTTKLRDSHLKDEYWDSQLQYINKGWEPFVHSDDMLMNRRVPNHRFIYEKDNVNVWQCINKRRVMWARAEVIDNRFQNHSYHDSLDEALNYSNDDAHNNIK